MFLTVLMQLTNVISNGNSLISSLKGNSHFIYKYFLRLITCTNITLRLT